MRVVVTGAGGQLGRSLQRALTSHEVVMLSHAALDVADPAGVEAVLRSSSPDAIVHAAAWTDVDGCETDPERARLVNVGGTQNVVESAGSAYVVCVSTDYVFNGSASRPYVETDDTEPVQMYGLTKLDGERVALASGARAAVARTAWLYGDGGRNFVGAIVRALRKGDPIDVVDDQVGSPTSCDDLARAIALMLEGQPTGVFHVVDGGEVSRCGFARAIAAGIGVDPGLVRAIATEAAPPRPAKRPSYAPLEGAAWRKEGFDDLPGWDDALARALPSILATM
ncbi:MAG: dTDP-4-dehydrorhamnose reductase [Actinomycetota bacterium]